MAEAQKLEVNKNNKSSLLKLKQLLKSVKNVFKIGKPASNIDNEIGKSTINKEYASKALAEVGSILIDSDNDKKVSEAMDCLKDANSINAAIPDIKLSGETEEFVNKFFEEKLALADKTAHKVIYKNNDGSYRVDETEEQYAEQHKEWIRKEKFSFTSAVDKYNDPKIKKQVEDSEQEVLNYMLKNYKYTTKATGTLNEGINIDFVFNDPKVQKTYQELQSMFKYQKSMIEINQQANKELESKSNDIANNLEQNTGVTT